MRRVLRVLAVALTALFLSGVAHAESKGLVVRVYADLAGRGGCDGFFSRGSDWPVPDATVTVTLPDGTELSGRTNAAGYAYFNDLTLAAGSAAVKVSYPTLWQFDTHAHSLESCPNSPSTQHVTPDRFSFGHSQVVFRARLSRAPFGAAAAACTEAVSNGGFEAASQGWRIDTVGGPVGAFALSTIARSGANAIRLGGADDTAVVLSQLLRAAPDAASARLTFSYWIEGGSAGDEFRVRISSTGIDPQVWLVVALTGDVERVGWNTVTYDVPADVLQAVKGQETALVLSVVNDSSQPMSVLVDDIAITTCY
jgi:hypothetical protein